MQQDQAGALGVRALTLAPSATLASPPWLSARRGSLLIQDTVFRGVCKDTSAFVPGSLVC